MEQDKFLFSSLSIGFLIVALIFFYEDYSVIWGGNSDAVSTLNTVGEDPTNMPSDTIQTISDPAQNTTPPSSPLREGTYLVKAGDTAFSIATEFNLSLEELVALNPGKVTDSGQKTPEGRIRYDIRAGDVLKVSEYEF